MTTAIVIDSVSRRASIISSRKASIVSSLIPDDEPFDVEYVKSGSLDLGQVKEGSVFILSVGDGSVNSGFVEENSDENASSVCGLRQKDGFSDGQPGSIEKADNISVMAIGPSEEPTRRWPFTSQGTEADERKPESTLAKKQEKVKTQTPPEQMTSPVITKKSDASKLSMRDYAMAMSLFYITFATYGNMQSFSVLTVEWLKEFPNSKSLILYVTNLAFALMCATGIIDGILINRFGIYKIMILGCFLQTSCLFGSSFSPNAITLVIVLGFLLGIASCFAYLNSFILMGLQFGDAGKFFIALLSLAGPFAGLVFSNLIPVFIELYAWRGSMFILAAINLQMIPLSLFLLLSHEIKKKKQLKFEARTKENLAEQNSIPAAKTSLDFSVLRVPLFLAYVWAMIFTLCGNIMIYSFLPSFLHSKGLGLKESAAIFSVYNLVSALARIVIGLMQRWFPIRFIHMFIGLASFFGLMHILINMADSYTTLLVSCIFLSLGMSVPSGLYNIGILECLGPEKYSSGASINETVYGISSALFGYLASLLVEYMDSYEATFCIYGAFIIASNFCLLITALVQHKRGQKGSS